MVDAAGGEPFEQVDEGQGEHAERAGRYPGRQAAFRQHERVGGLEAVQEPVREAGARGPLGLGHEEVHLGGVRRDELEQFDGQAALPLRRRLEADVVLGDGDVPAFQILVEPPEGLLDRAGDRVEQAVLRGEVDVDAAHCAVRGRGDPAHGRIPEAVGEELFAGGGQQRSPDVGGRAFAFE